MFVKKVFVIIQILFFFLTGCQFTERIYINKDSLGAFEFKINAEIRN